MTSLLWQEAYLGVSAILGVQAAESVGALAGAPTERVAALAEALQSGSRQTRARAIAVAVAEVVAGLDTLRLR